MSFTKDWILCYIKLDINNNNNNVTHNQTANQQCCNNMLFQTRHVLVFQIPVILERSMKIKLRESLVAQRNFGVGYEQSEAWDLLQTQVNNW